MPPLSLSPSLPPPLSLSQSLSLSLSLFVRVRRIVTTILITCDPESRTQHSDLPEHDPEARSLNLQPSALKLRLKPVKAAQCQQSPDPKGSKALPVLPPRGTG